MNKQFNELRPTLSRLLVPVGARWSERAKVLSDAGLGAGSSAWRSYHLQRAASEKNRQRLQSYWTEKGKVTLAAAGGSFSLRPQVLPDYVAYRSALIDELNAETCAVQGDAALILEPTERAVMFSNDPLSLLTALRDAVNRAVHPDRIGESTTWEPVGSEIYTTIECIFAKEFESQGFEKINVGRNWIAYQARVHPKFAFSFRDYSHDVAGAGILQVGFAITQPRTAVRQNARDDVIVPLDGNVLLPGFLGDLQFNPNDVDHIAYVARTLSRFSAMVRDELVDALEQLD